MKGRIIKAQCSGDTFLSFSKSVFKELLHFGKNACRFGVFLAGDPTVLLESAC